MRSTRALVLLVEAQLPHLLLRRDPEGDALPAGLFALDLSQRVELVLPPSWPSQKGRPVVDADLAGIVEAVRSDLLARAGRNRRWDDLERLSLSARRARPVDDAWRTEAPEARIVTAETDEVASPQDPVADVRLGSRTYALGAGCDRHAVSFGRGLGVLLALDERRVWLHPAGVHLRREGRRAAEPVALDVGDRFTVVRRRLLRAETKLADGEVLSVRSAPVSGPARWWVADRCLDADNPEGVLEDGDARLHLLVDSRGLLTLANRGRSVVTGEGSLGRFRLDRGVVVEALPGEASMLRVGSMEVPVVAEGMPVLREREELVLVPDMGVAQTATSPGTRRLLPLRGWDAWTHLGELYRASGVAAWFNPRLPCFVDGRGAFVGELLPVRGVMLVQLGPRPDPFRSLRVPL